MRTMTVTAEGEGGTEVVSMEVPNPMGEGDVGVLNTELVVLGVYAGQPTDPKRVGEIAAGLAARAMALERWVVVHGRHADGCAGMAASLDGGAAPCTCGFRELAPVVDARIFQDSTREPDDK